jgi:hypothetical protein
MIQSKTLGFLAWNLNAALDLGSAQKPSNVQDVIDAIEGERFVNFIDEIDPSHPGGIIQPDEKAEINALVRDRWQVRQFKYSGARNDPILVCIGFLLNALVAPPE